MNRIALLIMMALFLSGAGNGNIKPSREIHAAKTETRHADDPSNGTPIGLLIEATSSHSSSRRFRECLLRRGVTPLSALAVAIFTCALVFTSKRQWQVSKQAADAARENVDSLIAAETAYLDITNIEFTQKTAQAETIREGPDAPMNIMKLCPDKPLVVSVTIKNVGRTPAFEVGTVVEFSCVPALPNWSSRQVAARTIDIIGSGDSKTVECDCDSPLQQSQVQDIENGRVMLHARWRFSFTGIAERDYEYSFHSFYKRLEMLGYPQFDFPGYPRMRRRRTR
jgi:hypothetical protein